MTTLQTEVVAISTCTEISLSETVPKTVVKIKIDCHVALKAHESIKTTTKKVRCWEETLVILAQHHRVIFKWVLGHMSILDNEKADLLIRVRGNPQMDPFPHVDHTNK